MIINKSKITRKRQTLKVILLFDSKKIAEIKVKQYVHFLIFVDFVV
jgi:hypothetical protein